MKPPPATIAGRACSGVVIPSSALALRAPAQRRWALTAATLGALAVLPSEARADTFDWSLPRLVLAPDAAIPGETFADPASPRNVATGVPTAYRTAISEMSAALAPKFLSPSDTIGYSGFQFDFDYSFTTINSRRCADGETRDLCPWQYAVEGGRDSASGRTLPPGMIHTIGVMARKGIWLPLPSFEIGAGATKMMQSDLYTVSLYAKFALHEGFHRFPLPSLAVRGSGVRVLGSRQVDLTMGQVDISLSKSFGVGGTLTLVPYLGAGALLVVARGQVLDLTPQVDAYRQGFMHIDLNNNAVFPSQDTIVRWRFFGGFRINYSILVITADYNLTTCGDLTAGACGDKNAKIQDRAAHQHSFNVGAGFLF